MSEEKTQTSLTPKMTNLDIFLQEHQNVQFSSALFNAISTTTTLSAQEKATFLKIWEMSVDFENWNYPDLALGCKVTYDKLRASFELSDSSLRLMVRLASYDWK